MLKKTKEAPKKINGPSPYVVLNQVPVTSIDPLQQPRAGRNEKIRIPRTP
jgi:hypothetical protein